MRVGQRKTRSSTKLVTIAAIGRFDLPQTAAPLNPTARRRANGSATAEQKSEYLKQLAAVGF